MCCGVSPPSHVGETSGFSIADIAATLHVDDRCCVPQSEPSGLAADRSVANAWQTASREAE